MKYLKKFDTDRQYKEYLGSNNTAFPNVTLCTEGEKLYYNDIPRYIYYTATSKLPEVETSSGLGLHINAFNTNIVSHTFSNGRGKIEFENVVTEFGSRAFYGCENLTSITIPLKVTSIGERAFYGCSGLTSATIPESVTSIGDYAFYYCSGLTSVTIGNNVTSIGDYAFFSCTGLTSVTIGNNVTSIGSYAFYNCQNLTSVHISDLEAWCGISFSSSGSNPLFYAHHLYLNGNEITNLVIPNSITSIGNNAFSSCYGLTSVTIPNSVTSIGSYAFQNCSSLTSIEIPNSVTSIGDGAFYDCSSLTSVNIPSSVTSIGINPFSSCDNLNTIVVSPGNNNYDSRENCSAIIETATNTLISGCNETVIPSGVTSIGRAAFSGSGLTSIEIPEGVTSIGDSAFSSSGIVSVEIPEGVTSIGSYAFQSCSSLTSVTIPGSVTSINMGALSYCENLSSVTILSRTLPISTGSYAFEHSKIEKFNVPDISSWCYIYCNNSAGSFLSYGGSIYINDELLTEVVIPEGISSLGNNIFSNCKSITSVIIPNSVTSIGNNAFSYCTGLTSVTIGNNVTSMGNRAFYGCSSLTSITIPSGVTSIGVDAFYNCTGLVSAAVLATTPPTLGRDAFDYNASSRKIYVPASSINTYKAAANWSKYSRYIVSIPQQIDLLNNANNAALINTWNGVTLDAKLKDRTLYKDGEFNTICLPFDLDTSVGTPLEGAHLVKLYSTVFNSSEDALTINLIPTNNILAGTPYFIWWDRASDYVDDDEHNLVEPIFSGVTINNKLHPTESEHLILKGTYSSITLEANSDNFWVGSNGILYYPEEAMTIGSFRAYFEKVPSSDFQKTSNASTNILSAE